MSEYSLKSKISNEAQQKLYSMNTVTQKEYLKSIASPPKKQQNGGAKMTNGHSTHTISSDDDTVSLAKVKAKGKSSPKKVVAKISNKDGSSDDDDETPLNKIAGKKKLAPLFQPKKRKATDETKRDSKKAKTSSKPSAEKASKDKKKAVKKPTKKEIMEKIINLDDDEPLSVLKKEVSKLNKNKTTPKKKKQATLMELAKKSGGKMMSPARKSLLGKPRRPRQPAIVLRLLALKKEKNFKPNKYKNTIAQ